VNREWRYVRVLLEEPGTDPVARGEGVQGVRDLAEVSQREEVTKGQGRGSV